MRDGEDQILCGECLDLAPEADGLLFLLLLWILAVLDRNVPKLDYDDELFMTISRDFQVLPLSGSLR